MNIDTFLQGIILVTGIIGQLCVAHRNLKGFYFWMVCNFVTLFVSLKAEMYGIAALSVFYSIMCFYSIHKWRQLDKISSELKVNLNEGI